MPLVSLKKSTLSLKTAFSKHGARKQAPMPPTTASATRPAATSPFSDIVVVETTSALHPLLHLKLSKKQITLFTIIVEQEHQHVSLVRYMDDFVEFDALLRAHYAAAAPVLPSQSAEPGKPLLMKLRFLLTKWKPRRCMGPKLEAYLWECASHPLTGMSTLLRDFLAPQRDDDVVISKADMHCMVQQHALKLDYLATRPLPPLPERGHSAIPEESGLNEPEEDDDDLAASPWLQVDQGARSLSAMFPLPPSEPTTLVSATDAAVHMISMPSLPSLPSTLTCFQGLPSMAAAQAPPVTALKPLKTVQKTQLAGRSGKMTLDDLQLLKVLGKGCMGKVILVRHHATSRLYAMKAISKKWVITQRESEHTRMERDILTKVAKTQHPFIIKLHCSFQNANQLFLIMDYHVGSDLATQLQLNFYFNAYRCRFYAAEILMGLQELHRLGILYRDLKPENVLLAADGHVVLTDFGFSKLFGSGASDQEETMRVGAGSPPTTTTFCGTPEYMAPEVWINEPYTFASDYWSLGVLIYEMHVGYTPFGGDTDDDVYRRALQDPLEIPTTMSPEAADLIYGLLQRDPHQRLGCAHFFYDGLDGIEAIRAHAYFDGIDWDDVYHKRLPAPFVPRLKSETDVSHFDPDFVKLSPRLSSHCHDWRPHDDDDDDQDVDNDHPLGDNDDDIDSLAPLDDDYVDDTTRRWKPLTDSTCLDDQFVGYSFVNETTCNEDTDSLLDDEVDDALHHQQQQDKLDASIPPPMEANHPHHDANRLTPPAQRLAYSRFKERHHQPTRISSSFTLDSLEDTDDVVWIQ
ncbi:kinase-like domain-containing protein [Gongronella butleri]|nr:kinase-like domain-containing protein [Gongronella butleri]